MAPVDYKSKMADGSITVREAFKAVLDKKLTKSNKDAISSLLKALPKEGIDLDAPYFEVYNTKEFAEALDYTTNPSGSHRYKEYGAFETQLQGLIESSKRNEPYVRLSDSGGKSGIASRDYGLTGKQLRVADPMRGTIPSDKVDKIYHEALIAPSVTETDTKRGIDKPVMIDPEARDYLLYEKYTGQRVESNIGPDGLKITDFNFFTDENGNAVVEVASKQVGNKTRPEATYTGEFAEFLRSKVERAKEALPEGSDPSKVNLFQTTPGAVTKLWDSRIRPVLERDFRNQLPAQKGGSHSVVRKILARQLVVEFEFPRDAVKAWMGHAGAGVDSSGDILSESYVGTAPDRRIGEMTNTLVRNDALNSGVNNVNSLFSTRGAGFSQQIIFETPAKKVMGNTANLSQPGVVGRPPTAGELEELSASASARAVETEIATQQRRDYLSTIRTPTTPVGTGEASRLSPDGKTSADSFTPEVIEKLKANGLWELFSDKVEDVTETLKDIDLQDVGKKTLQATGLAAAGTLAYEAIRDPLGTGAALAKDVALEGLALAAKAPLAVAGAIPMILESTPAGEGSDIVDPEEAAQVRRDFEMKQMERIATEDAGFVTRNRDQEAAPAQEVGFVNR